MVNVAPAAISNVRRIRLAIRFAPSIKCFDARPQRMHVQLLACNVNRNTD